MSTLQRSEALQRANRTRRKRVEFRVELAGMPAGEARAALGDAIVNTPEWLESIDVETLLLRYCPRVGSAATPKLLKAIDVTDRCELRALTERQRRLLRGLLCTGRRSTNGNGNTNNTGSGEGQER